MAQLPAVLHRSQDGAGWRRRYGRGVSLHGHTCRSRESLDFIPRYARHVPAVGRWLEGEVDRYRRDTGRQIHFERGFWTGPLEPQQAWELEKTQIQALDLEALVSLTDHDDISAPKEIGGAAPMSCEWTVPFRGTVLHLGVHNLPPRDADAWLALMRAFTANPDETKLRELLAGLHGLPSSLVVLNHPLWALDGDTVRHCFAMLQFLREHRDSLHALEWNGIRPHRENVEVFRLARELEMPVVSGGDRHGCEPNSVLNVTAQNTFDEFIDEIRNGGASKILLMPQYDRCLRTRLMETMSDVLKSNPFDRIFYPGEDGVDRPISSYWQRNPPQIIRVFLGVVNTLASPSMRPVWRATFGAQGE